MAGIAGGWHTDKHTNKSQRRKYAAAFTCFGACLGGVVMKKSGNTTKSDL